MSRYPGGILSSSAPTVNPNTAKGIWTLDEAMRYSRAGQWPVPTGNGDPYFQYNSILLPGQGTNGAQNNTFLDSSTNNFTITRNGNTTQGTFTPFSGTEGNWSNYFDGNGDNIALPSNTALNVGTGDFTIEFWMYSTITSSSIFKLNNSSTSNGALLSSSKFSWHKDGIGVILESPAIALNSWNHAAYVRSGTSFKLYVNGVNVATVTNSDSFDFSSWNIGMSFYDSALNGFVSNFRIVKGVAVYTGNFTPPTAPLAATQSSGTNISAITGTQTSLLTCQSNRFVDNSTNAFALTANGNVAVTPFQPFGAPTSAYSASTVGGSGYFDGTGDYLTATANNAFNFGTGDFTVEGWIYRLASGVMAIWGNGPASSGSFGVGINSSNKLQMDYYGGTSLAGATNVPVNAWSYFAFVRTGSTLNVYLNGVRDGTTTTSSNNSTNDFALGRFWTNDANNMTNGYIADFRISDAYARYTGTTMTVPTAPLTNDGNTSVLLNFTNAGIIDNAEKNDLETVGNAQISTSQYKWGASSMYFDGTGDYLYQTYPNKIGTSPFTIEGWIYVSSSPSPYGIVIANSVVSTGAEFFVQVWPSGSNNTIRFESSVATLITGVTTFPNNTWTHFAITRVGTGTNQTKLYINGNLDASGTCSNDFNSTSGIVIGGNIAGTRMLTGYLSDLRVTVGYARYPYNFTAPTAAFPLFYQAAATPTSDPYFENTTLLLPGNGTNGAQNNTFLDSSTNAFTITRNGNTTQGTFTPFSQTGWGNYFDGTADYITCTSNAAYQFGTGDFTVEMWLYTTGFNGTAAKVFQYATDGNYSSGGYGVEMSSTTTITFGRSSGTVTLYSSAPVNQWFHFALVRSSGTLKAYINGVSVYSASDSYDYNYGGTYPFSVGSGRDGSGTYNLGYLGYISNFRAVKGTAVYTSNFTVPTSPLTAVSGTSLLTCQSNRFIDNSTNAFTITRNGDTSVQAFSPFNPTASYSTSTVGGSGYFDGSGDYLSIGTQTAFGVGTGAFTAEAWFYPTLTGTFQGIISTSPSTTTLRICITDTNAMQFTVAGVTTNVSSPQFNAWNHAAFVRSTVGGTTTTSMYLNGTRVSTNTTTTGDDGSTLPCVVGRFYTDVDNYYFKGYISGARILKGTAVYDPTQSTLTIPTAPFTNVANTSVLFNMTNGGITDATAKNDLETVGNASISTTQSKFGGSSMYFDGTGDYLMNQGSTVPFAFKGDFTVEFWVYFNNTGTDVKIYDSRPASTDGVYVTIFRETSNKISLQVSGSSVITSTNTVTSGTWYHVALARYGSSTRLFINGNQEGSTYSDTNSYLCPANRPVIASSGYTLGGATLNAYINDLRVTTGIARYTTNFTPPASAFLTL